MRKCFFVNPLNHGVYLMDLLPAVNGPGRFPNLATFPLFQPCLAYLPSPESLEVNPQA